MALDLSDEDLVTLFRDTDGDEHCCAVTGSHLAVVLTSVNANVPIGPGNCISLAVNWAQLFHQGEWTIEQVKDSNFLQVVLGKRMIEDTPLATGRSYRHYAKTILDGWDATTISKEHLEAQRKIFTDRYISFQKEAFSGEVVDLWGFCKSCQKDFYPVYTTIGKDLCAECSHSDSWQMTWKDAGYWKEKKVFRIVN